jgi:hypothetical protein
MTEAERLAERLLDLVSNFTKPSYRETLTSSADLIRAQAEELERLRALIGVWEKNYANQERLPPEFEAAIYSNLEGLYEDSAPPKAAPEQEQVSG